MGNQAFNVVVVLFWLATMSWLVVAKILPPLRVGEPPNYTSILADSPANEPSCWTISLRGRTIGWAANKIVRREDGVNELYSRVYLGELPLEELAPAWLSTVLKPALAELHALDLDKRTRLVIDPLGRLSDLESRVRLANINDVVRVVGHVDGSMLKLSVQSGEISAPFNRTLSPNSLVGDEFSPQARMPGLRVGQVWTVPLYSPFRSPHAPLDILQAKVEREVMFTFGNEKFLTHEVVYRGDSGAGVAGDAPRGRMWVRRDGTVLRQEVSVFKSPLRFDLLPFDQTVTIAETLGDNWNRQLEPRIARQLLDGLREEAETHEPEAALSGAAAAE